jgi:hypothetical protein
MMGIWYSIGGMITNQSGTRTPGIVFGGRQAVRKLFCKTMETSLCTRMKDQPYEPQIPTALVRTI